MVLFSIETFVNHYTQRLDYVGSCLCCVCIVYIPTQRCTVLCLLLDVHYRGASGSHCTSVSPPIIIATGKYEYVAWQRSRRARGERCFTRHTDERKRSFHTVIVFKVTVVLSLFPSEVSASYASKKLVAICDLRFNIAYSKCADGTTFNV